jgi:hypothetical protein
MGLRMAQMVQPQHVSNELRAGLLFALQAEAAAFRQRLHSQRSHPRGDAIGNRSVTRFHDELLRRVIYLNDSVTYPYNTSRERGACGPLVTNGYLAGYGQAGPLNEERS